MQVGLDISSANDLVGYTLIEFWAGETLLFINNDPVYTTRLDLK